MLRLSFVVSNSSGYICIIFVADTKVGVHKKSETVQREASWSSLMGVMFSQLCVSVPALALLSHVILTHSLNQQPHRHVSALQRSRPTIKQIFTKKYAGINTAAISGREACVVFWSYFRSRVGKIFFTLTLSLTKDYFWPIIFKHSLYTWRGCLTGWEVCVLY